MYISNTVFFQLFCLHTIPDMRSDVNGSDMYSLVYIGLLGQFISHDLNQH